MADDQLMVQQLMEVLGEVAWLTADDRADLERSAADEISQLTPAQEHGLLVRIIERLRQAASRAGDEDMVRSLSGDPREVAAGVIARYQRIAVATIAASGSNHPTPLQLSGRSNVVVGAVHPTPIFHGRAVPMIQGFVRVQDVAPWPQNVRLEIHLGHFEEHNGRSPNKDELLAIIQGKLVMPGLVKAHEDEFEVANLARSIAANGVQRPPIFDVDGTLLEGNRRIAACYLILESSEFSNEEKARAEYIFVWRLTEHATDEDREAVIVASNFEPDYKKEWADYIKAKKIYDEWEAMLSLEPTANARRQSEMKRQLAHRFGMGPDTTPVNRYIKMMEWANDFEVFEAVERERDVHAVRHQANRYFQYFDELSKGAKPGGVAYALGQDEALKHLTFDLLYEGKLASWMRAAA